VNYCVGVVTVTYEIVELMCLAVCVLYLVENLSYETEISLCLLAAGCPSFDMYKVVHSIHVWYMSLWLQCYTHLSYIVSLNVNRVTCCF
jgi:hypothetical protein